ncbi:hypothetical protein FGO68_gene5723 [Halteria grandinella]|uniref:Uncharacterized protein n=1 Tax=Halteria grandinella TaxID=5974 RepID=A0A8J8NHF1_HALGN|nr:hypothetical protein FGO68_gene5723 [Halteria grandinella]
MHFYIIIFFTTSSSSLGSYLNLHQSEIQVLCRLRTFRLGYQSDKFSSNHPFRLHQSIFIECVPRFAFSS